MQFKILAMLLPTLIVSSTLRSTYSKDNPSGTYENTDSQENSSNENFKRLKEIQTFESIFDDYHLGGIPYGAPG